MENRKLCCQYTFPADDYGQAILETFEKDDGKLWVSNGEYTNQVNFCPCCGYEAKKKIDHPNLRTQFKPKP
jgi:hypothetical protein